MTLLEIKEELPKLTLAEQMELIEALHSLGIGEAPGTTYDAWDLQMVEDAKPGGVLHRLGQEALEEYRRGETEEWP